MMSGIKRHSGQEMKFLTLTSKYPGGLGAAWHTFRKRIERMTPARLVKEGWMDVNKLHYYYPNKPLTEPLRMEYLKIETREGNGVLHAIFYGDYLPYAWLSQVWSKVHEGSWNIHISSTKGGVRRPNRVASYVLRQYVQNQSAHIRTSYNHRWVFKGFVGMWKALIRKRMDDRIPFAEILAEWDKIIERGRGPPKQVELSKYGI